MLFLVEILKVYPETLQRFECFIIREYLQCKMRQISDMLIPFSHARIASLSCHLL